MAKAAKKTPAKKSSTGAASDAHREPHLAREHLPIPDPKHVGLTTYDAKDPNTKYPPIKQLCPSQGRRTCSSS